MGLGAFRQPALFLGALLRHCQGTGCGHFGLMRTGGHTFAQTRCACCTVQHGRGVRGFRVRVRRGCRDDFCGAGLVHVHDALPSICGVHVAGGFAHFLGCGADGGFLRAPLGQGNLAPFVALQPVHKHRLANVFSALVKYVGVLGIRRVHAHLHLLANVGAKGRVVIVPVRGADAFFAHRAPAAICGQRRQ